jgi:sarcosine oxidase
MRTSASDVIVVGLGTAGAATCMELARRGVSVTGFDSHRPPHRRGSHHGESRSIRRAYLEGTAYVPMAMRAWRLWRRLERASGQPLLVTTGNLTIGPPDSPAVSGFVASARAYGIDHREMTAAEVRRQWPQLSVPDDFSAGFERKAGILFPERAVTVMLSEAERSGAELRFAEPAMAWEEVAGGVRVQTPRGRYEAGRLLLCAGALTPPLLGEEGGILQPKRVVVHWIAPPKPSRYRLGAFPVNFWQIPSPGLPGGSPYAEFYTLPILRPGGCVKAAAHNRLKDFDAFTAAQEVANEEEEKIRRFLDPYLPELKDGDIRADLCTYTLTPDGDFALGTAAGRSNVFLAALAGHGFKFAPVLGEILADLLTGREPPFDTAMFAPDRFR